ncbi:hypothetical protein WOLCODRAFT_164029 [Wolfiporia cocos MD-104 SS10]|uniref:Uncharacterized protein n=1 Tax=Wolfiporia cocos (strain MD-104) TaxID=742152 RepID=A0A2H3K1B0_WOLCO|nr:hypothetical protein WOLCODRAFT_164029 [Wolfiporia cocos MD-104 SS10]
MSSSILPTKTVNDVVPPRPRPHKRLLAEYTVTETLAPEHLATEVDKTIDWPTIRTITFDFYRVTKNYTGYGSIAQYRRQDNHWRISQEVWQYVKSFKRWPSESIRILFAIPGYSQCMKKVEGVKEMSPTELAVTICGAFVRFLQRLKNCASMQDSELFTDLSEESIYLVSLNQITADIFQVIMAIGPDPTTLDLERDAPPVTFRPHDDQNHLRMFRQHPVAPYAETYQRVNDVQRLVLRSDCIDFWLFKEKTKTGSHIYPSLWDLSDEQLIRDNLEQAALRPFWNLEGGPPTNKIFIWFHWPGESLKSSYTYMEEVQGISEKTTLRDLCRHLGTASHRFYEAPYVESIVYYENLALQPRRFYGSPYERSDYDLPKWIHPVSLEGYPPESSKFGHREFRLNNIFLKCLRQYNGTNHFIAQLLAHNIVAEGPLEPDYAKSPSKFYSSESRICSL